MLFHLSLPLQHFLSHAVDVLLDVIDHFAQWVGRATQRLDAIAQLADLKTWSDKRGN